MVELIPFREGFVGSATEFTAVFDRWGKVEKVFLWVGSRAFEVSQLLDEEHSIVFDSYRVYLWQWFERGIPAPFRFVKDIESYADEIRSWGLEKVRNRKVLLAYSGGKDSTACLAIAMKLVEKLGIDLRVVYVHMPYLEPMENIEFVEGIAKRLGIDIEVLEPKKRIVREYLYREGLPFRSNRWCTYLKTRPMREYRKRLGIEYDIVGDRLWETVKRFRRLAPRVLKKDLVKKRDVYLVAPLTLIDVVSIARSIDIIHRHYLCGASRVACIFCPYKSRYELGLDLGRVEDEGFIEEILRLEWRKWYRDYVDLETFVEEHLWRYTPRVAKMFAELKSYVEKLADRLGLESVSRDRVAEMYRSIWLADLEEYPLENIEKKISEILEIAIPSLA